MYIVLTMVDRPQKGFLLRKKGSKGFTLLEMMMVVFVVGALISLTAPSMVSLIGATQFTRAITTLSGVLEYARQYATTQNTYVWVALWEDDEFRPGEGNVCYVVIASTDGQSGSYDDDGNSAWNDIASPAINPFATTIGASADTENTNLQYQIIRRPDYVTKVQLVEKEDNLVQDKTTMSPLLDGKVYNLTNVPAFEVKVPYAKRTVVFDHVITFTPTGEAKVSEDMPSAIEFGIVRRNQKNPDCALFRINGSTGSLKVGRK